MKGTCNKEAEKAREKSIRAVTILSTLLGAICVHWNISRGLIVISEDRAGRILDEHLRGLEKRKGWIPPLCVFLPLVSALLTSTFKDLGFIKGSMFQVAFLIGGTACFVWLVVAVVQSVRAESVDDLLATLKEGDKFTILDLVEKAEQSGLAGPLAKPYALDLLGQGNTKKRVQAGKPGEKSRSAKK